MCLQGTICSMHLPLVGVGGGGGGGGGGGWGRGSGGCSGGGGGVRAVVVSVLTGHHLL